jgi:hypothetical protein
MNLPPASDPAVTTSFRMPRSLKIRIRTVACELRCSESTVVRAILNKGLSEYESAQPEDKEHTCKSQQSVSS